MGIAGAAIAGGVATVAGAAISSSTSSKNAQTAADASISAADIQAQSNQEAIAATQANQAQTRSDLSPFLAAGNTALTGLTTALGLNGSTPGGQTLLSGYPQQQPAAPNIAYPTLDTSKLQLDPSTAPQWNPTLAGLEQTPGYQWERDQGLKSVQNSYAAQGLGASGAAIKGGVDYAEGKASTYYQNLFSNYLSNYANWQSTGQTNITDYLSGYGQQTAGWQNQMGQFNTQYNQYLANASQYYGHQQQVYNMLGGVSGSGQNAAAGEGALSLNSTNSTNALTQASGTALASGVVGAANATTAGNTGTANSLTSGLSGLSNSALLYSLLNQNNNGGTSAANANSLISSADLTTNSAMLNELVGSGTSGGVFAGGGG